VIQLATAGTDTTGSAWMTLILPLGFLLLVLSIWLRAWRKRGGEDAAWEGLVTELQEEASTGERPPLLLPLLPGLALLPIWLGASLGLVVAVAWWRATRHAP
jgi:hypothetical protein